MKLTIRLPKRIIDGYETRANSHGNDANGKPNSSLGIEVERAFEASEPIL